MIVAIRINHNAHCQDHINADTTLLTTIGRAQARVAQCSACKSCAYTACMLQLIPHGFRKCAGSAIVFGGTDGTMPCAADA